jgi:peptide/nickel transport system ATP-binding protein
MSLLRVRDLAVTFHTEAGSRLAVDGVSFEIARGETLGLVGESGCGKSVTALSLLRLLPANASQTTRGEIHFDGLDVPALDATALRGLRGNRIAMIFQEPMSSLNPALTVGHQIAEAVRIHRGANRATGRERAHELLDLVRMPDAARVLDAYPHQLSGGQRQRVMIAMAVTCEPALLIADEPTTALDVTVQAQILDLLRDLKARTGSAILLITHDVGVVAEMCDRVVVMYAGRVVEVAPVGQLFKQPAHPYTRGLLTAAQRQSGRRLPEIEGQVPSLSAPVTGCAFHPRCPLAFARCRVELPKLDQTSNAPGQSVACHLNKRVG